MTSWLAAAVIVAFVVSIAATWSVRWAARRFDWLDHPSRRKLHTNPIPLMGGIAMYAAFIAAIPVAQSRTVFDEGKFVLAGATLLLIAGVIDDRRGMSPRVKLAAQIAAAGLLVVGGIQIALFPWEWLNVATTIVWVVGICNAVNLLDNMDGLSGGVAAIACATFTALALLNGQVWVSVISAILFGAILGFLWFNWNPASIFMGDAGSLLLGFLLAVLAIKLRFPGVDQERTWIAPILVLAIPILDTTLVTISRLRRGVSVSAGGRDHISHRLLRTGLTVRQSVAAIYGGALLCSMAAIGVTMIADDATASLIVLVSGVAGITALVALERLDLSDTGQTARALEQRPVARLKQRTGHLLQRAN